MGSLMSNTAGINPQPKLIFSSRTAGRRRGLGADWGCRTGTLWCCFLMAGSLSHGRERSGRRAGAESPSAAMQWADGWLPAAQGLL